MLILVHLENEQGRVHLFQVKYLETSQLHQLAIMYLFEQTNHSIHRSLLFQNLYKLFLCAFNMRP